MCGIFCSISHRDFIHPDAATKRLLHNRGPDSSGHHLVTINTEDSPQLHATFHSTVLSLRGQSIVEQPLRDSTTQSVLCWNGEAWSIGDETVTGNDSQLVLAKLVLASSAESLPISMRAVIALLASVKGPYAFVFYDASHELLYYGRDCLGRRSLLRKSTTDHTIVLSSVCDNASGESWTEVEADGIYVLDFNHISSEQSLPLPSLIPHRLRVEAEEEDQSLRFVGKSPILNVALTGQDFTIPAHEPQHRQQCITVRR
jgi:asparagine synthetase B (glutamine-hydrolysing)